MKTYQKLAMFVLFFVAFVAIAIIAATERIEKSQSQFHLNPTLIENGTIKGAPLIMQTNQKVCPGMKEQTFVELSGTEAIYVHCDQCHTGVLLENKEGVIECTFCSAEQKVSVL